MRDAVARQVDVEEKSVKLSCESEEGEYRPGKILFEAKQGKSLNLGDIRKGISATRLSGNTNMRVSYLEIVVRGDLSFRDNEVSLLVSGVEQVFELEADDRILEKQLREDAARSARAVTVVGRVDGWSGRFPVVLRSLAKRYGTDGEKPMLLVITKLEVPEGS